MPKLDEGVTSVAGPVAELGVPKLSTVQSNWSPVLAFVQPRNPFENVTVSRPQAGKNAMQRQQNLPQNRQNYGSMSGLMFGFATDDYHCQVLQIIRMKISLVA